MPRERPETLSRASLPAMTSKITRLRNSARYDELLGVVCELEDGSSWAVSGDDAFTVEGWTPGDTVEIFGLHGLSGELSNADTGETVAAIRYAPPLNSSETRTA
ncbi:MAG: hypothetical protein HY900_10780 [Deltaproteobacteria bacterium]|nr:hypothetical protein [Deltaproteobacteria bacterium]